MCDQIIYAIHINFVASYFTACQLYLDILYLVPYNII